MPRTKSQPFGVNGSHGEEDEDPSLSGGLTGSPCSISGKGMRRTTLVREDDEDLADSSDPNSGDDDSSSIPEEEEDSDSSDHDGDGSSLRTSPDSSESRGKQAVKKWKLELTITKAGKTDADVKRKVKAYVENALIVADHADLPQDPGVQYLGGWPVEVVLSVF